jgi:hypothetical protein
MDKIKIATGGVPLKQEVLEAEDTVHGFRRIDSIVGHEKIKGASPLVFPAKGLEAIKVFSTRLGESDVRIQFIEANLPKLLYGHNGRLLKSEGDLHLALTLLRHIVGHLVEEKFHRHLLPNPADHKNLAHIVKLEVPWHVPDPHHALLRAAQSVRMPRHSKSAVPLPGETALVRGARLDVIFYDKREKEGCKEITAPPTWWTRIEAEFKKPGRLHRAVYPEREVVPGAALRTITLADSFTALRGVAGLSEGLWTKSTLVATLGSAATTTLARTLVEISLMEDIPLPRLLAHYRAKGNPSDKTFKNTRREATRLLGQARALLLDAYLPAVMPSDPPEVDNPKAEAKWQTMATKWNWPTTPDADICAAWSQTTEFTPRPSREDRLKKPSTTYTWQQSRSY